MTTTVRWRCDTRISEQPAVAGRSQRICFKFPLHIYVRVTRDQSPSSSTTETRAVILRRGQVVQKAISRYQWGLHFKKVVCTVECERELS